MRKSATIFCGFANKLKEATDTIHTEKRSIGVRMILRLLKRFEFTLKRKAFLAILNAGMTNKHAKKIAEEVMESKKAQAALVEQTNRTKNVLIAITRSLETANKKLMKKNALSLDEMNIKIASIKEEAMRDAERRCCEQLLEMQ